MPQSIYKFSGTIKELKSLIDKDYNLLLCPLNLTPEKITAKHMDTCPPCIELNNLI